MSASGMATQVNEAAHPRSRDSTTAYTNLSHTSPGSLADDAPAPSSSTPSDGLDTLPGTSIQLPTATATATATGKKGLAKLTRKDTAGKDAKETKDTKTGTRTGSPVTPPTAIDPLSHHIFVRTNTDRSIAARFLNQARPDSPANEALPRPSSDLAANSSTPQLDPQKDRKKGGSFLSRLSMIGGKKKGDDFYDDKSEVSVQRTEGANAVVFSSAVGAGGYIPHHKDPPRYIRVRSHNKKVREFNRIFLAQELVGTRPSLQGEQEGSVNGGLVIQGLGKKESTSGGPIWAVEFSNDGRYLATGGRDRVVRIWAVIATEDDRKAYEEESAAHADGERLSAPVFRMEPVREFTGHTGDILDLSWSKNNFLLSSSMDKTVRLWHISRPECLCTFKHKDFVTSIAFHPRDDRFFLAGSLDSTLRLWSIPDKAVAYSSQLTDLITAVAFSPDGRTAIAGCLNGLCRFYETEGLKYHAQIHVRSSRGKNAKGSKITGIQTMKYPPEAADSSVKVLVTSNDSRIRIYDLNDKTLEMKLKGHENSCNQIRASFSDDGNYIICGSEDRQAYIWSMGSLSSEKEKRSFEYFEAHSDVVTVAVFAPTKTRQFLQASNDPIFTLCNPPPVTLLSKEERDDQSEHSAKVKKPNESPAFIARSVHNDGNIIVTTDRAGMIKVFRQDCAFAKRRHESWETGSTFSKRLARDSLLGRTGSILTRTSASSRDPRSRRGSLTQLPQVNSDRINTWRHGVEGTPGSRPVSMTISTPARSERSLSPIKAARTPVANPASEARRKPYTNTPPAVYPTSPTSSIRTSRTNDQSGLRSEASMPPTPSFSYRSLGDDADDLRLDPAGASYSFWNLNKWRNTSQSRGNEPGVPYGLAPAPGHARLQGTSLLAPSMAAAKKNRRKSTSLNAVQTQNDDEIEKDNRRKSVPVSMRPTHEADEENENGLAPPAQLVPARTGSYRSQLSSQFTASEDGEEMECPKCGSRDFRAKKVSGRQRLLCGRCGRMLDT
ncbi:WD40-repeat-containing domain protein [Biscogniauxia mediterranea]|nr:WD40-repeat-containing domain protein [Biscogniauxia mediterranea]